MAVSLDGMDFNFNNYALDGGFDSGNIDNLCADYGLPKEDRFPERFICSGPVPGDTQYCLHENKIYRGAFPNGDVVACIDKWGRIHKGMTEADPVVANIGDDNRIYEGSFKGICLGSIVNGMITLDGNYFPSGTADFCIF